MSSTARYSSYSCRSGLPQNSLPRSVSTRRSLTSWLSRHSGSATRAKTVLQCSDIQDKLIEQTACVRSAVIRNDIFAPWDSDQAHSLKLELAGKLPSLHDTPPAPSKHLTRCLRNRVQARQLLPVQGALRPRRRI